MPQVNLASIIKKEKDFPTQYQNELYRNIDFGIFDKDTMEVKLLIEINDKTQCNQTEKRDNNASFFVLFVIVFVLTHFHRSLCRELLCMILVELEYFFHSFH